MNIDWKLIKEKYQKSYKDCIQFAISSDDEFHFNCFCDFEKFFDDNRVFIEIIYKQNYEHDIVDWEFAICNNVIICGFKSRQEAKEQAIYKAFEILEYQKGE